MAISIRTDVDRIGRKQARGARVEHRLDRISPAFHAMLGAWVGSMLLVGALAPDVARDVLQEDGVVEWATVGLFAAAAVFLLVNALRHRRLFDALVGLFCLFVAGEEFSWGQRLLGFQPPEYFLANNFQQEVNLHNLPQWAIQPKWFLMAALAAYGLLLPSAVKLTSMRRIVARLGVTAPPESLRPWFAAAIWLLLWYPHTLTGEWVELLAGALFLASGRPRSQALWAALVIALVFAGSMTAIAGTLERGRDVVRAACAASEAEQMLDLLALGDAATEKFWRYRRVHKRIWTGINEGYVKPDRFNAIGDSDCAGAAEASTAARRKYGVDPWGTAYWFLSERDDDGKHTVVVYSFGPNRRRDGHYQHRELAAEDDIAAVAVKDQTK